MAMMATEVKSTAAMSHGSDGDTHGICGISPMVIPMVVPTAAMPTGAINKAVMPWQ